MKTRYCVPRTETPNWTVRYREMLKLGRLELGGFSDRTFIPDPGS